MLLRSVDLDCKGTAKGMACENAWVSTAYKWFEHLQRTTRLVGLYVQNYDSRCDAFSRVGVSSSYKRWTSHPSVLDHCDAYPLDGTVFGSDIVSLKKTQNCTSNRGCSRQKHSQAAEQCRMHKPILLA
jgi:hypothetical protein